MDSPENSSIRYVVHEIPLFSWTLVRRRRMNYCWRTQKVGRNTVKTRPFSSQWGLLTKVHAQSEDSIPTNMGFANSITLATGIRKERFAIREWENTALSKQAHLNWGWAASCLLDKGWMNSSERSRLEFELGPGGDHDISYRFSLPASLPQVLVWMRLLARVHRGQIQM